MALANSSFNWFPTPQKKTRGVSGERHPKARLSNHEVRQMRALREESGISFRKLAEQYGCGVVTAENICNYKTRVDV